MPELTIAGAKEKLRELKQEGEILQNNHDKRRFKKWKRSVQDAAANIFGEDSRHLEALQNVRFTPLAITSGPSGDRAIRRARQSGIETYLAYLESMIDEIDTYWHEESEEEATVGEDPESDSDEASQVFVVHGHDHGAKEAVARFLSDLGLDPIILHEKPNEGRSLLMKFEQEARSANYAVVLLTPDDEGKSREGNELEKRARQNVVFELGFFAGAFGSDRVCPLVDEGIELPSDYDGIGYVPFEQSEQRWRVDLFSELKAAGFNVDANEAFE